ncbi:hypothetical protein AVEN_5703-1 [Araneus ventricosus]|uniref:Uncharacterized protein n=1 Tax=Araneus ventricosus TaxID=182803 RepID=A0A4Y2DW03_ARAVE|nr:hypothetical protein AVEN_5703-1 [Araneus ventricosus]
MIQHGVCIGLIFLMCEGLAEFLGLMGISLRNALHLTVLIFWRFISLKMITTSELLITITGRFSMCLDTGELILFLTENENLIKQPPDATSSSGSDPDFSPSPRPQTYGL